MQYKDVYDYIIGEQTAYKTTFVPLDDNWEWNMPAHISKSFLYKHSKFSQGNNDGNRPFKNIVKPILNVGYRTEGFDVKDIEPFVNDVKNFYKSFLVRKFHPGWARDNDIDTFIDEMVESYVDYGLAVVKNVNNVRPEVVPLKRLAFCDQTDFMSGAKCEMHEYSVDQLLEMAGRWYEDKIQEAITMASAEKAIIPTGEKKAKTPSKYIEVFELHGMFPETWVDADGNPDIYTKQLHVVTYYTSKDGKKHGICLFKGPEKKEVYKALKRDDIFGRACGWGGVEELFEPQTWTNYSEIQLKEMLDVASLMLLQTADENYETKNKITDLTKGEILTHKEGQPLSQISLTPQNKAAFDNNVALWEQNARTLGSADEAQLGERPKNAGTPFRLEALIVQEGRGLHQYRQGKISTFMSEIYRDWVLQYLVDAMNQGKKFLEVLSADELEAIADNIVSQETNKKIKEKMMQGQIVSEEDKALFEQVTRSEFMKSGEKRFLEILKGELDDIPTDVSVNISGKQADLFERADKLTNVFRTFIANPQALEIPGMKKIFNEIMESSGFSPLMFSELNRKQLAAPVTPQGQAEVETPAPETEPVLTA